MKTIVLACLAVVAVASPQFRKSDASQAAILKDIRSDDGKGNFNYEFDTENGIYTNVVGRTGSKGQSNIEGSYRFTLDDGTRAEVRFVADEGGFRAESPLIPTPHPLPDYAREQIAFAQSQRGRDAAQGGRRRP
ncbi:cuticle protein AM1199 [Procambarus clarkii]|uniref:cuticle protein AM1199 n=1 Tax=Procambarus clarkii TaxID=6728 RepID=UPI0037428C1B